MELAGHECVGFCEFDKFAVASYTSMHLITDTQRETLAGMPIKQRQKEILKDEYRNGEWYANDIRSVRADEIPRADCWCFGFPCQDISIAGKQEGFNGHRSSLFFAVTKLIRDLEEKDRPKYLFIENVKNLLSINRGFDFLKLLIELDEIGYDAEWQLLNSKDFGVPQNRERVFIIGHLRGRSTGEIFPVEGTNTKNSVYQIGNYLRTKTRENPNQGRVYDTKGIAPCLNRMDGGGREPSIGIKIIGKINFSQDGQVHDISGIAKCHSAGHNNLPKVVIPVLTPDRTNKRQNGRRFKENGEPMFTLTAQDRHGVVVAIDDTYGFGGTRIYEDAFPTLRSERSGLKCGIGIIDPQGRNKKKVSPKDICPTLRSETHGNVPEVIKSVNVSDDSHNGIYVELPNGVICYAIWYEKEQCYITIRKLTPKECFRLQGWSDEYFERAALVNSDSQLYKQAGIGVSVPVVKVIGDKIAEFERKRFEQYMNKPERTDVR